VGNQADRALHHLKLELDSNVRAFARNCERLRWALQYYTGDEPVVFLPDWDWSWPPALGLERPRDQVFRYAHWREGVAEELAAQVEVLYGLLLAQPPDMTAWAEEYTADVALLAFILEKLEHIEQRVADLAARVGDALGWVP
jgi:hypothetical protein